MHNTRSSVFERSLAAFGVIALAVSGGATLEACSGDDTSDSTITPAIDSGSADGPVLGNPSPGDGEDASAGADAGGGTDASTGPTDSGSGGKDASDAAPEAAAPHFCAARAQSDGGVTFCSDFDEGTAVTGDGGLTGWDEILNAGTLSIMTTRSVSAPGSLALSVPVAGADGRLTKTLNQAVQQVTYEFDMYIEAQPKAGNAGSLITDLQFTDDDAYGFRVLVFSKADGTYDRATLEHNGAGGDVNPITLTPGAWNHIKLNVAFSSAGSANKAALQGYIGTSLTPAVDKTYDAPAAKGALSRIRLGKVFAFGDSQEYKLNFDNVVLKLQ